MAAHHQCFRRRIELLGRFVETLEDRRLLAAVTLDTATTYQTVQGWGSAPLYPDGTPIATIGAIMRDAGFNTVRVTAGPGDLTFNKSGDMSTPVPLSSNLDANVALFGSNGMTQQTNLVKWLTTNGLEPDPIRMTGSIWSPPNWLKIPTGQLITWTNWDNTTHQDYGPFLPYGQYGGNTGGGRVDPAKYTDLARFVLSDIKAWEQQAGLPMYALNFQNEPDVETFYSSASYSHIAKDLNDLSKGYDDGQWQLYANALQAIATERASHPEITTKLYGPELSSLGPSTSNPWFLSEYNQIRQKMIANGSLSSLGGYAIHGYESPRDGEAALWDAFYNGTAHAANIISNGSSNVLGWLWPIPGVGGDGKEIWQTETGSESNAWTKDGALGYGLKIHNALVYGNVNGYTVWELGSYNSGDTSGLVNFGDLNNPTNSFNYDAMKQFSRWIRPGAQRIKAVFENGKASIGGANELDTYNGLNVSAFNQTQDKRLTMVFVNMQTSGQSTTISIPAGLNVSSFQVYQTTGTQKYVQLSDLTPSAGQISLTVPASGIVTITGSYAIPTLPAPWTANDIGSPSPTGSSGYNASTGTFTLGGGGADIWNNSDQFQFASQSFSGNGSIIARVTSVQNTNTWAKAGVMFRDSTAAGAMFADVVVTPSSGVSFQWRNSTGGGCGNAQIAGVTAPAWVKLIRSGNSFTAYYATTTATPAASDWIQIGSSQTIAMSNAARVGLAVTSHANGTLCTSTFSGVQINQAPTIATPAAASPNPVTGTTANLSVLGADDTGEASLTYTWASVGTPPAPVTFSGNGTNTGKNAVASFTQSGSYQFQVTLTDSGGLSTTSSIITVPVTVPRIIATDFLYDAAPNKLAVTFDADMTGLLASSSLSILNTTVGGSMPITAGGYSYDPGTMTGTFTLPGTPLVDGNYHATLWAPGVLVGDSYEWNFFSMTGDADHDRTVDTVDFNILASNFGKTGQTFGQGDFNYDNTVDTIDFNLLASNFGKFLAGDGAAPIAAAAALPSALRAAALPAYATHSSMFATDPIATRHPIDELTPSTGALLR